MKIDILAIGIHPDDVELSCAGTLLKHAAAGRNFVILDLSRGELGTRGTPEIREKEARAAAKILGAADREILDLADGFFQIDKISTEKIIAAIRKYRPEIVLCNAISDRHPDHGRAAKLVADACFYSGLEKIETFDNQGIKQEKWRPKAVYHYIQDNYLKPDFVVDVSPFFEKKMEAILAFGSQFFDPNMPGEQTPISGKDFLEYLAAKDKMFGRPIFADFAEGFQTARTPGVDNLFDLK